MRYEIIWCTTLEQKILRAVSGKYWPLTTNYKQTNQLTTNLLTNNGSDLIGPFLSNGRGSKILEQGDGWTFQMPLTAKRVFITIANTYVHYFCGFLLVEFLPLEGWDRLCDSINFQRVTKKRTTQNVKNC